LSCLHRSKRFVEAACRIGFVLPDLLQARLLERSGSFLPFADHADARRLSRLANLKFIQFIPIFAELIS
jgi:hypothetical protein